MPNESLQAERLRRPPDLAKKAALEVCRYCLATFSKSDIRSVAAIIRRVYAEHDGDERRKPLRGFDAKTKRALRRKPLDAVGVPLAGEKGKVDSA